MSQGIVMSIDRSTAVVMTSDGRFVRLKKTDRHELGLEVAWDSSELASSGSYGLAVRKAIIGLPRRWVLTAASVAAMFVLLFGIWSLRPPEVVAYVSMDINPSVELGLDSKERVRVLRAINRDARPIVEGIAYKGHSIEDVARQLADKLAEARVLSERDSEVVIASVPVKQLDSEWERHVTGAIEKALSEAASPAAGGSSSALRVTKISLPEEVREEAKTYGVSSGKMAFWLKAESEGHEVSLDTLKKNSLKKIASSWGGVDKVMTGDVEAPSEKDNIATGKNDAKENSGNQAKDDKKEDDDWKKLLDNLKTKKDQKQQTKQTNQTKQSNRPKQEKNKEDSEKNKPQKDDKSDSNKSGGRTQQENTKQDSKQESKTDKEKGQKGRETDKKRDGEQEKERDSKKISSKKQDSKPTVDQPEMSGSGHKNEDARNKNRDRDRNTRHNDDDKGGKSSHQP
ncbi:anti-sigma factor domain-containing protein [Cohnella faecalis]|uniref:RsgI N-terminal anti-sigma domain-containing protein n=1 Tax=Cohnella faecalis TaxID=2315694 RepID=A0A398CXE5_9BACL|nr:anti-sigma factor domain-containing protein [Cohnella faecalis]RIE03664.1 hypothetical protein D3H35_10215 [Cohnella faecalis]